MCDSLLQIDIRAVLPTPTSCAVFLGNEEKVFVIHVEQSMGYSLSKAINGEKSERPMTHDLIDNCFQGFGVDLEKITINAVEESIFFARVLLKMENDLGVKFVEIAARPSDSLVLAVMKSCPIFILTNLFEELEDVTAVLEKLSPD